MSESKHLAKPKFIKIKDLERERSGYNVYVKVISADHKTIETHDGKKIPMVNCVVADETGSANAFFKGETVTLIQKGNVVAIRNGIKKFIKNFISLEIDIFGRVTAEKEAIEAKDSNNISNVEHKLSDRPRRQGNNNRRGRLNNRGGPRRDNNRREDREDRPRRENRNREDREDRPRRDDRNAPRRPRDDREDRGRGNRDDRDNSRRDLDRRDNRYTRDNRRNDNRSRRNDSDFDREERPRNSRRYEDKDRRDDRDNRERRAPISWTKIADVGPGDDNLNIIVKVRMLAVRCFQ